MKASQYLEEEYRFIVKYFTNLGKLFFTHSKYEINEQIYFSIQINSLAQDIFVVAHEFAHIYAGHLNNTCTASLRGISKPKIEVDFYIKSQQQELEADRIAMSWILTMFEHPNNPLSLLDSKTKRLYPLMIFNLFHLVDIHIKKDYEYSTHPPSIIRLENILETFREYFSVDEVRSGINILESCKSTVQVFE